MNLWDKDPDSGEVDGLVQRIRPILAGKHPALQSAALVELTAIWLAGCVCLDDEVETQKMHDEFLAMFVETVKLMVLLEHAGLRGMVVIGEGGDDASDIGRRSQSDQEIEP